MSDTTPNLATALAKVQGNLPTITKNERANTGKFSYTYASLADIHAALLPLLAAEGLAWVCAPTLRGDGRYVLSCTLIHGPTGETLGCELPLPQHECGPQELGSAITYGRRYAICSLVGIAPDEDDDGQAAQQAARQHQHKNSAPRPEPKRPTKRPAPKKTITAANALNLAVAADTPEKIREIWNGCDLNERINANDYGILQDHGIEGDTLREVLTAIANHVKETGGPVRPLWNETQGA